MLIKEIVESKIENLIKENISNMLDIEKEEKEKNQITFIVTLKEKCLSLLVIHYNLEDNSLIMEKVIPTLKAKNLFKKLNEMNIEFFYFKVMFSNNLYIFERGTYAKDYTDLGEELALFFQKLKELNKALQIA